MHAANTQYVYVCVHCVRDILSVQCSVVSIQDNVRTILRQGQRIETTGSRFALCRKRRSHSYTCNCMCGILSAWYLFQDCFEAG